ncbi:MULTISPECIES: hypothetical protein [unclassified Enterobacter]|uniref:hypothetical protein n=1 Tax=unclassified Enterobacter TaxID=2608935 RepID=UPI000F4A8901|nr:MULTISPECIES: hypothetical protein [unclassified Enterobacter]
MRGFAVLSLCRNKVAEQLLEIGAKAGIVVLAGAVIKDVADKMISDELDHLITLEMMGNGDGIGNYLIFLQYKYGSGNDSAENGGVNLTDAEKTEQARERRAAGNLRMRRMRGIMRLQIFLLRIS